MTADSVEELTEKLRNGNDLGSDEVGIAAHGLTHADLSLESKAGFLRALAEKGETPTEVASFASIFTTLARNPGLDHIAAQAIDIVGTGGDKSGSFNISTTSAFVVAAAGVPVLKHGNRSITSKCGSADFLAAIGFELEADDETLQRSAADLNFAFLFAPAFHPAFKEIMPVRKALAAEGQRTIFNILGPLINPARPAYELMGVFSDQWVAPLAGALGQLGLKSGLVVHCRLGEGMGMDELSSAGENVVRGFGALEAIDANWSAESVGLKVAPFEDLLGGTLEDNLELFRKLPLGKAPAGLEDSVALNAGAAFWIAGKSASLKEGIALARETIKGGALQAWLARVREFYGK